MTYCSDLYNKLENFSKTPGWICFKKQNKTHFAKDFSNSFVYEHTPYQFFSEFCITSSFPQAFGVKLHLRTFDRCELKRVKFPQHFCALSCKEFIT